MAIVDVKLDAEVGVWNEHSSTQRVTVEKDLRTHR